MDFHRHLRPVPQGSHRSATVPSGGLIETLYSHPNAKIVSFTASGSNCCPNPQPTPDGDRSAESSIPFEPCTLSWTSPLERTLAVGPLRIYRAAGSVAFINCGSALQPILPKSQCWCMDDKSTIFVLQIRRPHYWRIELPTSNRDNMEMRQIWNQVLQFEKTECPFHRSFVVEIPTKPETPVKKRSWVPPRARTASMPIDKTVHVPESEAVRHVDTAIDWGIRETNELASARVEEESGMALRNPASDRDGENQALVPPVERLPKCSVKEDAEFSIHGPLEDDVSKEEARSGFSSAHDLKEAKELTASTTLLTTMPAATLGKEEDLALDLNAIEKHSSKSVAPERTQGTIALGPAKIGRKVGFDSDRSFTAPPQLSLNVSPPSKLVRTSVVVEEAGSGSNIEDKRPPASPEVSSDPFRSVHSWLSPMTPAGDPPEAYPRVYMDTSPTFPYPYDTIRIPKRKQHRHRPSDLTATPETRRTWDLESNGSSAGSQGSAITVSDTVSNVVNLSAWSKSSEYGTGLTAVEREPRALHHRQTTSSPMLVGNRVLSPLPPAANLFFPKMSVMRMVGCQRPMDKLRSLPFALLSKACGIFFGTPLYLVQLMLKVATRILSGEWSGSIVGFGENGESIPVAWDYTDGSNSGSWEDDNEPELQAIRWQEFAKDQQEPGSSRGHNPRARASRSWEVD